MQQQVPRDLRQLQAVQTLLRRLSSSQMTTRRLV
jgi:hypothetical protein